MTRRVLKGVVLGGLYGFTAFYWKPNSPFAMKLMAEMSRYRLTDQLKYNRPNRD